MKIIPNWPYEVKAWLGDQIRYLATDVAFWLIRRVHKGMDRTLSQCLFELAERYNTRPGTNNYAHETSVV